MKKLFLMAFLMTVAAFEVRAANVTASGNDCGANCSWTLYDDGQLVISGTGDMYDFSSKSAPWYSVKANATSINISGLRTIGAHAFQNVWSAPQVTISDSVESIGYEAFTWSTMGTITIPSSVTTISGYAFRGCNTPELVIENAGETPTTIGVGALSYIPSLQSLVIGDNVILGEDAFIDRIDDGNNAYLNENLKLYCPAGNTSCAAAVEKILATDNAGSSFSADMVKTYTKTADGYYQIDGELFGSADMMPKGSDYSCGATTSICATVLSEVGGENCDTIKSCRNLAEMADESVYCNSMSGCKELTDLVASETYCDSLESCKALSDMAASGEYCTTVEECKALNDMVGGENCDSLESCKALSDLVGGENCDSLESCKALSDMAASGEYCTTVAECKALNDMVGGENCDSLESCKALSDMAASGEYCSTVAECKRFMDLMNSGYCEGFEACKEMFNASVINYDGKRYGSLEDLYNGNALPSITRQEQGDGSFAVYKDGVFVGYKGKRIYTMEEANRVTKPTGNTFKIKYR